MHGNFCSVRGEQKVRGPCANFCNLTDTTFFVLSWMQTASFSSFPHSQHPAPSSRFHTIHLISNPCPIQASREKPWKKHSRFALRRQQNTVKITLSHVAEQDVAFWRNIEQAFPGFKRARNGDLVIYFTRVSDPQSLSSALDVVLTASTKPDCVNS
ncbi:unnamed protein product [Mortierella alpina]